MTFPLITKWIYGGILTFKKADLLSGSVITFIIYNDLCRRMYVRFIKDNLKVIGTSTINMAEFDEKNNSNFYNRFFEISPNYF